MPRGSRDTNYKSWQTFGDDAVYIYKYLLKSKNTVTFKDFVSNHQDWVGIGKYKERNLRDNLSKCKKRQEVKEGKSKYIENI